MAKLTLTDLVNLQNETTAVNAINANNTLTETAMENTLSRDGTSPNSMSANLDMNSNRILNLPYAISSVEPVTLGQFEAGVATSGAAPSTSQYVVLAATSGLSAERVLTAGSNIVLTDAGAGSTITVATSLTPNFTSATLTTLNINSGGIFNWNAGDVLLTHSSNQLAFSGATSYTFDALLRPSSNDVSALGTTTESFSDLFLASGGVINWNAGDVLLTHSANTLAHTGASLGYTFDAPIINTSTSANALAVGPAGTTNPSLQVDASTASAATGIKITAAAAAGRVALATISSGTNEGLSVDAKGTGTIRLGATSTGAVEFSRNVVPTASDGAALGTTSLMWSDLFMASGAVINFNNGDVTITHATDALIFTGGTGYTFDSFVRPATNDVATLGAGTIAWSDLFLASGGIIDWNNGDVTLTHSSNLITVAGGDFGVTGNITSTGYVNLTEIASPSNPSADNLRVFAKDVAGSTHLFTRDSAGTEVNLTNNVLSSAGYVLIQTQTASSSAQIDFTTGLDDTYDAYEFVLSNVKVATDDVALYMRIGTGGGPTYQTANYRWATFVINSGGTGSNGSSSDSEMQISGITGGGGGIGNAAGESLSGTIRFNNPEITTDFVDFQWHGQFTRSDSVALTYIGGGKYDVVGAITGIRFLAASGNLASGRFSLYGIKKS